MGKEIKDHQEIIERLVEVDRKLKLLAVMLTVFVIIWAFQKTFPIIAAPYFSSETGSALHGRVDLLPDETG